MDSTYVEHTRISIRYASLICNNHLNLPNTRSFYFDFLEITRARRAAKEINVHERKEFLHAIQ